MPDTHEWIYVLRPTRIAMLSEGPTEEEQAVVQRHFGYLQALTEQGVVVLAGRTLTTDERTFGIVVFRSDSETSARELMSTDPAVRAGVMAAELYPYQIALLATQKGETS